MSSAEAQRGVRCPGCGGAMTVEREATGPRPPSTVAGRSRISVLRKTRRKRPVAAIVLSAFVAVAVAVGGYVIYRESTGPQAGARALGLLPSSTLVAVSVEQADRLAVDLSRSSGGEWRRTEGAIEAHRRTVEGWLTDALNVSPDYAAQTVRHLTAVGEGVVPVDGAGAERVVLLVPRNPAVLGSGMFSGAEASGRAGGLVIYRHRSFAVRLGRALAVCRRREPLQTMAESLANKGVGSLEAVDDFVTARARFSRKGAAWFYSTGHGLRRMAEWGPAADVPELVGTAAKLAPGVRYAAGFFEIRDPRLFGRAEAPRLAGGGDYEKLRVAPIEPRTPAFVPDDADVAVAMSVGDPVATYDRVLPAVDAKYRELFGERLSDVLRRFERRGDGRLVLATDLLPVLAGEVGYFSASRATPVRGWIVPVRDARTAERPVAQTVRNYCGSEPRETRTAGLRMWSAAGAMSAAYAFFDDVLVVGENADALLAVRDARASNRTLAGAGGFRTLMASMPAKSTCLIFRRESRAEQEWRHGGSAGAVLVSLSMGEGGISASMSMPNVAEALMISVPPEPAAPVTTTKPEPVKPLEERSRENLRELVGLCERFRREKGKGAEYPGSFADLLVYGYITRENLGLLVRPEDRQAVARGRMPATSYEAAFDAAKWHRFTGETPGELPMMWEMAAAHEGKRLVACFDGTIKLDSAEPAQLVTRLREAFPEPAEKPPEKPPEKPDDGKKPPDDGPKVTPLPEDMHRGDGPEKPKDGKKPPEKPGLIEAL